MTPSRLIVLHTPGRLIPPAIQYLEQWTDEPRRGSVRTIWNLLAHHMDFTPTHDLIILEDDVIPCTNALEAITQIPVPPRLAFLQFCEPGAHNNPGLTIAQLWPTFSWSQALKFPPATIRYMLDHPPHLSDPRYHGKRTHTSTFPFADNSPRDYSKPINRRDWALGESLTNDGNRSVHYGIVRPSFFQHIGMVSVADPNPDAKIILQSPTFRQNYDASTWQPTPTFYPRKYRP